MNPEASSGFIVGDKVVLRGVQRADMEHFRRWVDNAEVTAFLEMGWRPTTEVDLENTFKSMTQGHEAVAFIIEEKRTGAPVGTCGLYLIQWVARRAQFNILIGEPRVWDKGLGTETTKLITKYGFDVLNLESIQLGVNADNVRAVRSYENAGFVLEGRRRKFIYRNGRYYDCIYMGILREEFVATTSAPRQPARKRGRQR